MYTASQPGSDAWEGSLIIKGAPALMSEKVMAPRSSTLAWKIPWTEEPGGLLSVGSHTVEWSDLAAAAATFSKWASQMALVVENSPTRRHKRCGLDPWVGKIPSGGHGSPLHYSCLEDPVDRQAWWAIVRRVTRNWTQLKQFRTHTHPINRKEFWVSLYVFFNK